MAAAWDLIAASKAAARWERKYNELRSGFKAANAALSRAEDQTVTHKLATRAHEQNHARLRAQIDALSAKNAELTEWLARARDTSAAAVREAAQSGVVGDEGDEKERGNDCGPGTYLVRQIHTEVYTAEAFANSAEEAKRKAWASTRGWTPLSGDVTLEASLIDEAAPDTSPIVAAAPDTGSPPDDSADDSDAESDHSAQQSRDRLLEAASALDAGTDTYDTGEGWSRVAELNSAELTQGDPDRGYPDGGRDRPRGGAGDFGVPWRTPGPRVSGNPNSAEGVGPLRMCVNECGRPAAALNPTHLLPVGSYYFADGHQVVGGVSPP